MLLMWNDQRETAPPCGTTDELQVFFFSSVPLVLTLSTLQTYSPSDINGHGQSTSCLVIQMIFHFVTVQLWLFIRARGGSGGWLQK